MFIFSQFFSSIHILQRSLKIKLIDAEEELDVKHSKLPAIITKYILTEN